MAKNLFLLLLFNSYFVNAQFGIVQDKDGFVNVRDKQNTSSKILSKVKSNTILPIDFDDNPKWTIVKYKDEKMGYIFHDRIKKLEDFESINPNLKTKNRIEFTTKEYSIELEIQKFNSKNHSINSKDNLISKIDGKSFYGTDGMMPLWEYKTFKILYKGKEIEIPKECYSNLYNPHFENDASK